MATIHDAKGFHFTPPPEMAWARRVLLKPYASTGYPYPISTSRELLDAVVSGIRRVTDAEILIADGTPTGEPIYPAFQALHYNFNRVLLLDVKDSIFLEMENPLQEFYASPTFWVPNLVLRSDFLISIAPFHIANGVGRFTIANLLSLMPLAQPKEGENLYYQGLKNLEIERVLADLYFTLPFDMGIVEGRTRFDYQVEDPLSGKATDLGKIIVGAPLEVDRLAARLAGASAEHLTLIERGQKLLEQGV